MATFPIDFSALGIVNRAKADCVIVGAKIINITHVYIFTILLYTQGFFSSYQLVIWVEEKISTIFMFTFSPMSHIPLAPEWVQKFFVLLTSIQDVLINLKSLIDLDIKF